jgi:hypothetical protein
VALDPGILTRDVHIEMVDNAGNPRSGTITFRNTRMSNGEQSIPEDDIVATLNGSGQATVTLIANINNPAVSPDGTYWRVTEQLDHGFEKVRYVQVDAEDAADPIEYASLLDTEPGGTGATYVTQAQLLQAVADAIAGAGLDPDAFARLIGADPITGTFVWDMPIEADHADQIGAIRIVNNNEVDASVSPDLYAIYYKPVDPDNLNNLDRTRWDNEWGGIRIRIPGNPAKLSYGDVGMKIFEAVGGGRSIEIADSTGAVVFHIQNGLVTTKAITTTVGPQTFAGNTTMAGTLGVTGAVTMSSTLAVTGQVTVPATPVGTSSATSKSYVDGLVGAGAPDASSTVKGILKLTNDLGGTAALPTVPGLAAKADDSAVVHKTGAETVAGVKTFSSLPVIPATPSASTDASSKGYVDGLDAANVKLTGAQTVAGNKTLSGNTAVGGTLAVTGATTLSSTLGVTGAVTASSTVSATGAVSGSNLASDLTIGSQTAITIDSPTVGGRYSANAGSTQYAPAARLMHADQVQLSGRIEHAGNVTTANDIMATDVGSSFRPAKEVNLIAAQNGGSAAAIKITASGNIVMMRSTTVGWTSLDGLTYRKS